MSFTIYCDECGSNDITFDVDNEVLTVECDDCGNKEVTEDID